MRKFLSFAIGIGLGALLGAALVALFSPVAGADFRANLRRHYEEALVAARKASTEKRREIETELERMRERRSA